MKRFENKSILITGASSGIGRAAAIRLAAEGAKVLLIGRDEGRLIETQSMLMGSGHAVLCCELTDDAAITSLMANVKTHTASLHGVAHCAGVHWLKPVQLTDSASLQQMLASHVQSSLSLVRAMLAARLPDKDGCAVALLSSVAALKGGPLTVAYAAAKGALISAARVLAIELAKRKIRVNVIVPGVVRTPQSAAWLSKLTPEQAQSVEASHPLGVADPEDIASSLAFLLSDDAKKITGTTLVVDGGLSAQ